MNAFTGAVSGFIALGLVALLAYGAYVFAKKYFGTHGLTQKRLLTPNELEFYFRLQHAVQGEFVVLVQVAMGALVDTTLKPNHPDYWKAKNAFNKKMCDFVLCEPATLAPVLIVELDDVMHDFKNYMKRDSITAIAGYKTIRFWSRNKPKVE